MSWYWPWWAGALALGTLTVTYWIVLRRPLGVSGLVGRFVEIAGEVEAVRAPVAASDDEVSSALEAATRESFGCSVPDAAGAAASVPARSGRALGSRIDIFGAGAFLLALAAGGLLSRLVGGGQLSGAGLGPEFQRLFGEGPRAVLVLAVGGGLVGLGTSLADGCSTGHGLTGSARLQPGSLLSTASFMASAVAVSLVAGWLAS